jgi:hypothetical protein
MLRAPAVPLVESEQIFALLDAQCCFRNLHHQGVALDTERTVAGSELDRIMCHAEAYAAAVAGTAVHGHHRAMPSR